MGELWHIRVRYGDRAYDTIYNDPKWEDNWHYLSGFEFVEGSLVLSWDDPPKPMDLKHTTAQFLIVKMMDSFVRDVCAYQDGPKTLPEGSKFTPNG